MLCSELLERLGEDELLVLDCRQRGSADPLRGLQIPGALWISPSELDEALHVLPEDELIVLCGVEADGSDAETAWSLLTQSGRTAVCLDGGLGTWVRQGYPTEPRRRGARADSVVDAE